MNTLKIERARLKSLRFSTIEGFFCSVMNGFGESCFGAFGLFLGASNWELAVLEGLPVFIGGASQIFTLKLLNLVRSRKKMVCWGAAVQALMLLPIAFLPALKSLRVEMLILFATLYFTSVMVTAPVWNSWMGDLVTQPQRGRYFGRRNAWATSGQFLSLLVSGFVLKAFADHGMKETGFALALSTAMLARFVSVYFLSRKLDLPCPELGRSERGPGWFIAQLGRTSAGRVALYSGMVQFATLLTSAYFTPYVLREVGGSYPLFFAFTGAYVLTTAVFSPFWGRFCQERGSSAALKWSGLSIAIGPVFWLFPGFPSLILLSQFINGVGRSGWNLSILTSIYETTAPHERARFVSQMNVMNAVLGLCGALAGAVLVNSGYTFQGFDSLWTVFFCGMSIRGGSWIFHAVREDSRPESFPVLASAVALRDAPDTQSQPLEEVPAQAA